jgi:DNA-binding CsgD family transcriptional regulator/tetratricopeptide (TPR) repeat protein
MRVPSGGAFLPGRRGECERLRQALADGRSGRATALLLTGEAGIGKTALLEWVAAEAAGFRVLCTIGSSAELAVPYAALYDLLVPIFGFRESLPTIQSAALAGALALEPTAGNPLAVGVATLGILAAAAENQPTLVLVDDLQWVDPASKAAVTFAARRLRAEKLVVVATSRADEPAPPPIGGMPSIHLAGLDAAAAGEMLATGRRAVSPMAARRLVKATGGNPLALWHASAVLDQLDGSDLEVQPTPIEPMLDQLMRHRFAALPADCRRAMLLLAIEPDDPAAVTRAMQMTSADPEVLLPAEEAGLVTLEAGRPAVTHPLVRSAVYHSASARQRRAAHKAISRALEGWSAPLQAERRALHLALAAASPDPAVAAELEQVATTALAGGRFAAASELFERAGQLSLDPDQRSACLIQAAELAFPAGQVQRAGRLLDRVRLQIAPGSSLDLRCRYLLSRVAIWQGRPEDACQLLLAQNGAPQSGEAATQCFMLSDAGVSALMLGDRDTAAQCAHNARIRSASLSPAQAVPVQMLTAMLEAVGGDVADARVLLEQCAPLLRGQEAEVSGQWTMIAALAYVGLDELAEAGSYMTWLIDLLRQLCTPGLLPFPLSWHAKLAFRKGDWALATAQAQEAVDLARSTQDEMTSAPGLSLPDALATLALIEAGLGEENDCRKHAGEVLAMNLGAGSRPVNAHAHLALGILELGDLNYETAYRHLEMVRDFCLQSSFGESPLLPWAADLAEAAGRIGHNAAAADAVAVLEQEAARTSQPTARAGLARCSALAAGQPRQDSAGLFRRAASLYAEAGCLFEQARTELYWGEQLRRNAKPGEARPHLDIARRAFASLGAQRWAARAGAELRAAGGRVKHTKSAHGDLTPQELRVGLTVAQGLSNVEAANRLFLSPKTIEFHLGNVFRKLGVQNRAALVTAMARGVSTDSQGST